MVTCSGTGTARVGQGPGANGVIVTLSDGASIVVVEDNAISLGNNAAIILGSNGPAAGGSAANAAVLVKTTTNEGDIGGQYHDGDNTIDIGSNSTITVNRNASIIAAGTAQNAEAINPYGSGNTIINYGLIQGGPSSAIFFQNVNTTAASPVNTVENFGTIQLLPIGHVNPVTAGEAVGSDGNVGVYFTNETGGTVLGNLDFQGGNDVVTLNPGSNITGNLNGGGGNNLLVLNAAGTSRDTLAGQVVNFQTLNKTGSGIWTLSGTIGNNNAEGAAPLAVHIIGGTLVLTGGNTAFNGTIGINPSVSTINNKTVYNDTTAGSDTGATLEARAQSLPPLINDQGILLINQISPDGVQPANGAYTGLIQGAGVLTKIGGGTLTLSPRLATGNRYSGGTNLDGGSLAIAKDNVLGTPAGPLTFNGGTLLLLAGFNLAATRSITLASGGGTIDTNGFQTLISHGISGPGGLTKAGAGTLILNGDNSFRGTSVITGGTLALGDSSHPGEALSGAVQVDQGTVLAGYGSVSGTVTNNATVAVANALGPFAGLGDGSFTLGGLVNAGLVDIASSTTAGNILRVDGNYAGSAHAVVELSTVLNGGGPLTNQFTDRLLIRGNVTGTTTVIVNATGGGAYTNIGPASAGGISLIQVAGSSSPTAFSLPGGFITGGTPFQYRLNAYGPGSPMGPADGAQSLVGNAGQQWDYRLQAAYAGASASTPGRLAVAPQVAAYLLAPEALFYAGFDNVDELHRRLGEIRQDDQDGAATANQVFVRVYGSDFNYASNRSFSQYGYNMSGSETAAQFGLTHRIVNDVNGTFRIGLAATFGQVWYTPDSVDGQSNGSFTTKTVAATATWQDRTGWYWDAVLMGGVFAGEVKTDAGKATDLSGNSFLMSLELGDPIALGSNGLVAEPEAQLTFQHLEFAGETDANGIALNLGEPNQGLFRAGSRLLRNFNASNGMTFTPYAEINILQGIGGGSGEKLSNVAFTTGNYGTALQLRAGVTGQLSQLLSLYGDITRTQDVGAAGFRGWGFNGGLKYAF